MNRLRLIIPSLLLCAILNGCGNNIPASNVTQPLQVSPSSLSYSDLFSSATPASPVMDSAFAMPANAAAPTDVFEGSLALGNTAGNGSLVVLRDDYGTFNGADSPWKHLAAFSFDFVQDGSYLIPAQQGLVYTGNPNWNYIVGPGNVWSQSGDSGYTRASFPFALIERNQNCVHNGEMTFLFSNSLSPNISNVRYQITQETCDYSKFNMWGQIAATYTPNSVTNDATIKSNHESEIANRLPTRPFSALTTDFPNSGVIPANFISGYQSQQDITTYGLYINGVNYVSGCQTRYGEYAFCGEMRLPSYSTAKSVLNGMAMMRLGQLYGPGVYSQLIKDYVPQYIYGGDWSSVTFDNAINMATGNYISSDSYFDELSSAYGIFNNAELYAPKIDAAFTYYPHQAAPGTTFVYQSVAMFIVNQAMNSYLQQQQGSSAEIFNMVHSDVYAPIHISEGFDTLRTDNNVNGKTLGYIGLFYIQDDIAKLAKLLNNDNGVIGGKQVLDPARLRDSLFQNPSVLGLPVPAGAGESLSQPTYYNHSFWGTQLTPANTQQYTCSFWIAHMEGHGGISVALLPNGSTFYLFSDDDEYAIAPAVYEINKLSPLCP